MRRNRIGIRPALCAAFAAALLAAFAVGSAAGPAVAQIPDMRQALGDVFAKQQRNGDIAFSGSDSLFYRHPVMATLSLETFRKTRDYAFLQKAHGAVKDYFNYLLVYRDSDRDLLVERSSVPGGASPQSVEDPGFNALLALDMASLSQICVELGMSADALFWYRGMRVVSDRVVRTTYDPESSSFLPSDGPPAGGAPRFADLAVLPVYFADRLGDELPIQMIRNHLLAGDAAGSGAPARYLTWDFSSEDRASLPFADRLLRAVLLLGALESNGLGDEAAALAAAMRPNLAADSTASRSRTDAVIVFLSGLVESNGPFALFPRHQALTVLDEIVFRKSLLDAARVAALRRSAGSVREFVAAGGRAPAGSAAANRESVDADVRQVYFSISLLREKWKARSLFAESERTTAAGFDLYAAMSELFDDAVDELKTAENIAVEARWRSEGFDLAVSLEKQSVGPGEPVPLRFSLAASAAPVGVKSLAVLTPQGADTLMSAPSPVIVAPDAPARVYAFSHPAPRGTESALAPLVITAEVLFADGKRDRIRLRKSVFVTRPVTCTVRFPNGATLANGSVPVEILVKKNLSAPAKIQAEWYSPAGIKPAEGRSVEASMPENAREASLFLNILVPNPCRPGSFPFTLRVFADGKEVGTFTSKLFRHYEWLVVGPFPGKKAAIDTKYPPETEMNLFDTYTGALGQLVWQPLPAKMYADDGRLKLGRLVSDGSVGFLYTVIETSAPRASTAVFESSAPAVLYLNGEVVARASGGEERQRVDVALKSGMNNVLVKTHATAEPSVFFQLGDEEDLMADEFNNNLWELVDGYQELVNRGLDRARDDEKTQRRVTLVLRDADAASVAVVGSFNGWSGANSSLRKNKYGEWEIGLFLAPGRYTYRFVVNDSVEIVDPASPYTEPDGYGGQNSVLYVQ
jgi:hypothetical protein